MKEIKIDKIIRSKRKTLALEVAHDATLILRAPERTPIDFIEKFIFKKRFWIQEKQRIAREKYQKIVLKEFVNGEGFLYLGDFYRLFIVDHSKIPLFFNNEFQLSKNYLPFLWLIFPLRKYRSYPFQLPKKKFLVKLHRLKLFQCKEDF